MPVSTAFSHPNGAGNAGGIGLLGVFDAVDYAKTAVTRARDYQTAQPFPHMVLDDFLPPELARQLSAAFPGQGNVNWVGHNNANNRCSVSSTATSSSWCGTSRPR